MKTKSIKKTAIILTIISFILISMQSCKEEKEIPEQEFKEITGVITFKIGSAFINDATALIGNKVSRDDGVRTGKKSAVVIQFSDKALITLHSDTTLRIAELTENKGGKPLIELYQDSGSSFNKIVKNKANYSIKTPTSVASVRGTSFSVLVQKNNNSRVRLLHGEVNVANPDNTKSVTLNNNQKIEASAEAGITDVKPLDNSEKKRLENLDRIEIIPEENLESTEKPAVMPEAIEKIITSDDQKEDTGYSISFLKRKYGKLSRIQTKDGRTFIGAFRQVGSKMEITSTKGKFTLPVSKIKKVSPY